MAEQATPTENAIPADELMELSTRYETKRLRVFVYNGVPPGGAEFERETHVGWLTQEEQMYPVVVLTLWASNIEMIWVHDFYRRQGLAREIISHVRKRIQPDLHGDGVSEAGEALVEAMNL